MLLTTKGRYAIMAMIDLAKTYNSSPVTLLDISLRQNIALNYLEQIFLKLKKANLVKSVKGPGGGYMPVDTGVSITLYQIIDAVEEKVEMTRCGPKGTKGCMPDETKCNSHDLWEGLTKHIISYLKMITLQDMVSGSFKDQILINSM